MTNPAARIAGLTPAATAVASAIPALTARGAITCDVTLPAASIAFSSRTPAVSVAAYIAPTATGATSRSGLAVTSKMSLIAAFVARLGLRRSGAFSADVAFGSAVVAGRRAFLRAIASLVRRVATVITAAFHRVEGSSCLVD